MDNEAREKIAKKLGDAGFNSNFKPEVMELIFQALYEVGYRKLPKDKPPLLSAEEMGRAVETYPVMYCWQQDELKAIAQAQREADIKHYEQDSR